MADAKLRVFCLNLDEARDRWARTQEAFAGLDFVELVRVPGVRGDRLPRAAALEMSRRSSRRKSELVRIEAEVGGGYRLTPDQAKEPIAVV